MLNKKPKKTTKQPELLDSNISSEALVKLNKNSYLKRTIVIVVMAVIFLATIFTGIYLLNNKNNKAADTKKTLQSSENSNNAIIIATSGDIEGATTLAKYNVANATDFKQKVLAYNALANVYLYAKNYSEATSSANNAIKLTNNAQSWVIIGQINEDQKNYTGAADAYQKAVDLSVESKEDARGDYNTYMAKLNKVKELQ
jgi:tetratricopeptide (TPR) repeat protein